MPTTKQKRQQSLSWALYICTGFRASAKHFIPDYINEKQYLLKELDYTIDALKTHLKRK